MSDIIRQRIQARLDQLGISANEVSTRAGMHRSSLAKFLSRQAKEIRDSNLRAVAKILECDPAFLRGEIDNPGVPPTAEIEPRDGTSVRRIPVQDVPIVGIVEAGAFRPVDWFDDIDLGSVNGFDPSFPKARQFGFSVRGDSMNLVGINDGDEVICIDPIETEIEPEQGDYVVVENRLDGGHTRELTVKELLIHDDRFELMPRSSNPKHRPLVIPRSPDLEEDREVQIVGIVTSIVRRLKQRIGRR